MAKTLLAIRHIAFEDLGYFEKPLIEAGFEIRYHDSGVDDLAGADADSAALVVVLGGPMGVYEEDRFPFLTDELRLIEARIAAGKPLLGICLGAQLIARAMGASVHPGRAKEIGFAPVRLTAAGRASPLAPLASGAPVLHWHGDTFDLPSGTRLLASTDDYANQAFSAGAHILGLQFHLEAGSGIEAWLAGHAAELAEAHIDPDVIRADARRAGPHLEQISRDILSDWLAAAGFEGIGSR